MHITPLIYTSNSSDVFAHFAHLAHAVYLDSCQPQAEQGRYDIISALPDTLLSTHGKVTTITHGSEVTQSSTDPFTLTQHYLHELQTHYAAQLSQTDDLPFHIGAIGYFGYDLSKQLESIPSHATRDINLPDAVVGIYDWSIVIDHKLQQAFLISAFDQQHQKWQLIQSLLNSTPENSQFQLKNNFTSNMRLPEYASAFAKIKEHIHQGNCYQANLSQRFSAQYQGSPWDAYQQLRQSNPAPYAAFLNLDDGAILSLSPERFLRVTNSTIETKPIKGTSPRYSEPEQDTQSANELLNSNKDKAENLMIVDLLRNDLGKCCVPGSIQVPKLFDLESFANVHHLVSTITGKLESHMTSLDLLRHCFPGGSITGTPKIRAMQIIEQLEPNQRNLYCGSIAAIDMNGNMQSNICIRTLLCDHNTIHCSAGGAIVSDSVMQSEYDETLVKVRRLLDTLENHSKMEAHDLHSTV